MVETKAVAIFFQSNEEKIAYEKSIWISIGIIPKLKLSAQ